VTIDELIERLSQIREQYGNLPVRAQNEEDLGPTFNWEVEVADFNGGYVLLDVKRY
jgi:hypothetical protein